MYVCVIKIKEENLMNLRGSGGDREGVEKKEGENSQTSYNII